MELTRDEILTVNAILNVIINEVPYRDVNMYLGDYTIDKASELLAKITKTINKGGISET